ncbi:uncharacterized protein LAESUDRAFT_667859 [Laetiporus sulphureus 93-53]|uniref:Uncharacterized protein n=1 Tax=Laetiporus sulphureus 93-53 TaxID=1314785 RepID=A0A165ARU6_9APHY|nr:uncharacterized protein LAESUDRAFT_667859 [Laetiporus sulphureus 93-53]KZS99538.1 hypothetical protein LAESUDRAFT_667859 [Laetiporus sulphureus 93-53]
MHYDTHVYARDGDSDNGGLSASGTIAIIVVCICIAILAFSLFLWRFLYRLCSRKKSNPLPPAQPPVHGRSYQAWVDRKAFQESGSGSLRGLTYYNLSAAVSQGSLTPASSILNGRENDDALSVRSAWGPVGFLNYSLPNPVLNPYASMISVASSAASEDGAFTPHASESVSHISQALPSHPTARGPPRTQSRPFGRRSVHVDQWVPIRPRSLSMINSAGGRTSSPNLPFPRSRSQSRITPSANQTYRRSQSQPRMDPSPLRLYSNPPAYPVAATSHSPPPPVPQLPAEYSRTAKAGDVEDTDRGRSLDVAPRSTATSTSTH